MGIPLLSEFLVGKRPSVSSHDHDIIFFSVSPRVLCTTGSKLRKEGHFLSLGSAMPGRRVAEQICTVCDMRVALNHLWLCGLKDISYCELILTHNIWREAQMSGFQTGRHIAITWRPFQKHQLHPDLLS